MCIGVEKKNKQTKQYEYKQNRNGRTRYSRSDHIRERCVF